MNFFACQRAIFSQHACSETCQHAEPFPDERSAEDLLGRVHLARLYPLWQAAGAARRPAHLPLWTTGILLGIAKISKLTESCKSLGCQCPALPNNPEVKQLFSLLIIILSIARNLSLWEEKRREEKR